MVKVCLNVVSSHFRYFSLVNLKSGQAIYVKPNVGFCCIVIASCFFWLCRVVAQVFLNAGAFTACRPK